MLHNAIVALSAIAEICRNRHVYHVFVRVKPHHVPKACPCVSREGVVEEVMVPEEAGARAGPGAAGLAAVERLQRAPPQDDHPAHQGLPSPPKRAYRAPSVTSLCSMATRATAQLMAGTAAGTTQHVPSVAL